jgi:hypothetical protein
VSDGGPGEQGVRRQAVAYNVTNWKFVTTGFRGQIDAMMFISQHFEWSSPEPVRG